MSSPDTTRTASIRTLKDNYARVQERIAHAAEHAGRSAESVRLIAVSKTYPLTVIHNALNAGMTIFGENRPQELAQKAQALRDEHTALTTQPRWCAIGRLQRNKAREIATYADEFHALDSVRLAQELDKRLRSESRTLDVFIQVNTSGEEQKGGFAPEEVAEFLPHLAQLSTLRPRGFMTMAQRSNEEKVVRSSFARLRNLRDSLCTQLPPGLNAQDFQELSMGMSGDFEWAIAEGATSVRVGTAIFGQRN
ncbi:YggS family pyridoxal phosphate-dependent enzyme [Corynebacterium sp. sy039]|uniref:YggS family pyridoxal phosphate-dependent enzyme n=1 Tax=Corynebacterium sp. sy039 TaxID=2599641 RepID=UPI0011B577C3|nr:YggS family pyridoxal phosphate-dependent enzyme [Corynebacterium sp. sy039]QDZ43047.1 YggS family pyridoxal phosphate-dependent enzyme [Corynebacterium sp. sy039]